MVVQSIREEVSVVVVVCITTVMGWGVVCPNEVVLYLTEVVLTLGGIK
jgi:hypothetical protein